jgi:magnesium transporter
MENDPGGTDSSSKTSIAHQRSPFAIEWVEVIRPTATQMDSLAERWNINLLAVEDCLHRNQRSKFEDFGHHQFMVIHGFTDLKSIEFHFIIRNDAIIMVTDHAPPTGDNWCDFFQVRPNGLSASQLLYMVLDKILDLTEKTIAGFYDRLFEIEKHIFSKHVNPQELLRIRHFIGGASQKTSPLPSVIRQWIEFDKQQGEFLWRLRDLLDHAERIRQSMEFYQQSSAAAMDMYWGWTSKLVNDQMEKLTALAAIFMPLTFWTGLFGMNFQSMPFQSHTFFVVGILSMFSSVTVFYFILRKKGYW